MVSNPQAPVPLTKDNRPNRSFVWIVAFYKGRYCWCFKNLAITIQRMHKKTRRMTPFHLASFFLWETCSSPMKFVPGPSHSRNQTFHVWKNCLCLLYTSFWTLIDWRSLQRPLLGPFPIRKAPRNRQWLVKPLLALICEAFPAFQPRKPPKKISHPEPKHTQLNKISQDFEILHDTFVPCTLFATEPPSPKTTNTTATDKPKEPSISRRCGRGLSVPALPDCFMGRPKFSCKFNENLFDWVQNSQTTKAQRNRVWIFLAPKLPGMLDTVRGPSERGCSILEGKLAG